MYPIRKSRYWGVECPVGLYGVGCIHFSSYTSSLQERPFNAGVVGRSALWIVKSNHHEEKLVSTLYEGLVYYDEDARSLKPRLEDWKISADGRKLTIELKRNILFHNGKQLTAADV